MLFLYATRIIRVTDKLKMGIVVATSALCLFYLVAMVLSFFHVGVPLLFSSTKYGIGFSLFVVGLAAFNLLLDFDFIEKASATSAPKYMEWYGAFGLMVTLIWLYLEILRLLDEDGRRSGTIDRLATCHDRSLRYSVESCALDHRETTR